MENKPTSEEKLWAVISQLSVFLSGTGLMMPAFAWAEYRKKSKYVAFQALQAFCYQSLGYTLWSLAALIVILILTFATLPLLKNGEGISQWMISHIVVMLGLYVIYLAIPVIAAIQSVSGREYYYPLLGKRLARFIGYDPAADPASPLDEPNVERFAAAMADFAIVYPLWGMLPSLLFLILPGVRSRYMQFHSLQTVIFQAISTIVTIGLGILSFFVFLSAVLPFAQNPTSLQPSIESMLSFFVFLLCLMLVLLIVPLYQIVGQWAGLQILRGYDYHYSLIGRWAERWLAKQEKKL